MEPEHEVARVNGLGKGDRLGFSLILTDLNIIGVDTRKSGAGLWLGTLLGLAFGLLLVILIVLVFGPVLFSFNPLVAFIVLLLIVFLVPGLTVGYVPRILKDKMVRTEHSFVHAPKKDIISIETRKPGRATRKGHFTVRLVNGTSFTFWTVGQDMFDHVNSLLAGFAPGQMSDQSFTSKRFTESDVDRLKNESLVAISAFVILLLGAGALLLLPYISLAQVIDLILGGLVAHFFVVFYLSLRRKRKKSVRSEVTL